MLVSVRKHVRVVSLENALRMFFKLFSPTDAYMTWKNYLQNGTNPMLMLNVANGICDTVKRASEGWVDDNQVSKYDADSTSDENIVNEACGTRTQCDGDRRDNKNSVVAGKRSRRKTI